MTPRESVARALAYFEHSDDLELLHGLLGDIAGRVKRLVSQFMTRGSEDAIPPPADLNAAREPATREEAIQTLRTTNDFALLQSLARAIGRRVEALEIVASADFAEGSRVEVPERVAFPPPQRRVAGTVASTGTSLTVHLDNGETWEGPPSLARKLQA